jgi:hypothetical protein
MPRVKSMLENPSIKIESRERVTTPSDGAAVPPEFRSSPPIRYIPSTPVTAFTKGKAPRVSRIQ